MSSKIQVQVDNKIKVAPNPYAPLSELELQNKLEKSREHAAQGKVQDADEVTREMRAKYGL